MKSSSLYRDSSKFGSSHRFATLLGSTLLAFLTACGGSSSSTVPTPTANTTAVQVNMGDAPADWLLAFSMNVSSMSLTRSDGSVTVSNTATPIEMIHRLGTMEPIALVAAPQGTYTGASLTVASCSFTYLDPETKKHVQKSINGPTTVSIPFGSSITVGTTPLAFNFDLDLERSLTMDGSGAFQFSPQFHTSTGALGGGGNGSGNGGSVNARYGGMYQMMGVVSGISASSFSIVPLQATNTFTFKVNTATQFRGIISTMAQLGKDMGVLVSANLQSDGTMLATRVRATMSSGGAMGGGVVTFVDKQPATQLALVMQNGAGAGMLTSYLSNTVTVNLTDSTTYEIDSDRVSLSGLPFTPAFDASNIYVGQSVLPFSASGIAATNDCGISCGIMTASTVRLREQGFRGTTDVAITPGASGTFVLTLMPGCAFTTLTGAQTILVHQQTGTNVESTTVISAGTTLRVHGLLFNNGGEWTLIASTIASS